MILLFQAFSVVIGIVKKKNVQKHLVPREREAWGDQLELKRVVASSETSKEDSPKYIKVTQGASPWLLMEDSYLLKVIKLGSSVGEFP